MEYIIIGLCVLLAIVMIVAIRNHNEKSTIIEYQGKRIYALIAKNDELNRLFMTSQTREKQARDNIDRMEKVISDLKLEKLKSGSITNDLDLSKHLRFLLPDSEVANNVTVKVVTGRDGNKRINATVRKKVKGVFTNVKAQPILITESVE